MNTELVTDVAVALIERNAETLRLRPRSYMALQGIVPIMQSACHLSGVEYDPKLGLDVLQKLVAYFGAEDIT